MADATTTRYQYVKPEVGASADTWGAKINQVFDDLDAMTSALATAGSANAYTLTTGLSLAAYVTGQRFKVIPNFSNTGAATLNVDAIGAKNIYKNTGGTLGAVGTGNIVSGVPIDVVYDGTQFVAELNREGQPIDAELTALAALSYSADSVVTMTGAATFTLAASSTFVRTTGDQSIAGAKTFTGTFEVSADYAGFYIRDTAAAADNERWRFLGGGNGIIYFQALTDDLMTAGTAFSITRTGATVTEVDFASGTLKSLGVAVRVAGKTALPVPAAAMVGRTTNGAAAGQTETTTNKIILRTLDFDQSTDEYAQFVIPSMPKSWNEGTITAQFIGTSTGTGDVVLGLQAVAISDDDVLDAAFGTAQYVTDTMGTANDQFTTAETSAITIAGTPAVGDMVVFQVVRAASNGSDTLNADYKLLGVKLFLTTDAANDA